MKLFLIYLKRFYEKYRYLLFTFLIISMIFLCLAMIKTIIFDFPNDNGENNINYYLALSQLFGGILGGIFTIIGVSLTIFKTNNDRKNEIIRSDKPRLLCGENIKNDKKANLLKIKLMTIYETYEKTVFLYDEIIDKREYYSFHPFDIYITNNADCILEKIIIAGKMIYPLEKEYILKKDNTYTIDLSNYYFAFDGSIPNITLAVLSLMERKYYFTVSGNEICNKRGKAFKHYEVIDYSLFERTKVYDKIITKLEEKLDNKSTEYINIKIKNRKWLKCLMKNN